MAEREQEIFLKIKGIIQELSQQNEILLRDANRVSDLELKLFLAKAHFLTNLIEILQQVHSSALSNFQKTGSTLAPIFEINKSIQKAYTATVEETRRRAETVEQPISNFSGQVAALPTVSEAVATQPAFAVSSTPLAASTLKPIEPTPQGQTIPASPNYMEAIPQLTDISAGISLNDKWLFVKELFGGVTSTYAEALELVNKCQSFEEADKFLHRNYAMLYKWSEKEAAFNKFYTILGRRFPR